MSDIIAVVLKHTPDKPVSEFSDADREILYARSVEDALNDVRKTLALTSAFHDYLALVDDDSLLEGMRADVSRLLAELQAEAWKTVKGLSDAMPESVVTLRILPADATEGDE